ncbi:hypothetical protein JR316_0011280 [Psilocybe cubensis]|uniref:Uncharacterized protein n=2 Tax=Psilocybe cubensis TaxID=181762 RepID=A0A8H7XWV9_PSICU|nr:hypothetical protein JR316_0011280 [Psilocybe cubensis]KAH9475721.1 hypothetical protein JR316_0011280 [Psilocybe cubensis]
MTTLLNKAGKELFAKHLEQYAPQDPLYEFYTNERGKQKRRKRAIPPGLSKRDAKILKKLMSRAHYLDKGFSFCGLRFGWTFIIGMIPLVGDVADISLNYLLIVKPARKLELPNWLLRRMMVNNAVSAGVGFVPVAGDVFVGAFKANSRNVALVEEFLRIRGEEFIKMGGVAEEEAKKGWFGTLKGRQKATAPVAPMSPQDVEQVKPGAGMSGDEMKNSLSDEILDGQMSNAPVNSVPARSGSSGFSLFGSRKSKGKNIAPNSSRSAQADRGRFVEDADVVPGAIGPSN